MAILEAPLDSVEAYVSFLSKQDIPVLRRTVRELESLREEGDGINARRIAATVLADPLMTMKLLAHLQANRRESQNHDITTIDRAIMMMGITPFFNAFSDMPTLESRLAAHPKALLGALQVIGRARKAAHLARDWAIVRHDLDVEEITVAALLREATEIICWTFAPTLTLRIQHMQARDHALRSVVAQRTIFGVTAKEIQLGLVRAWNMPALLVALLNEANADNPRVRNVRLASNFARHLERGWENAALPDDITEIGKLLPISREQLLKRVGVPPEHMLRFGLDATG
jgi:HD-like signal output (HDOD) protein